MRNYMAIGLKEYSKTNRQRLALGNNYKLMEYISWENELSEQMAKCQTGILKNVKMDSFWNDYL